MRKPDTILDEVHAIRRKINEATEDMTSEYYYYLIQNPKGAADEQHQYNPWQTL